MTANDKSFSEELTRMPGQVLFDLARNEAAAKEWRKAAVAILVEGDHRQAQHPELRELRLEIEAEAAARREVEAVVEAALEGPVESKADSSLAALAQNDKLEPPQNDKVEPLQNDIQRIEDGK